MNGIINVYKEAGYTSFDVVAKLRGILGTKKIGHTGTLDPDAVGVLPVCIGNATKLCELLTDKEKEYETVLLLGITTDTQDISGNVLTRTEVNVKTDELLLAIQSFAGSYAQIPPMYSALKVNGRKLCDLAREGITVERKPREVMIHEIEVLSVEIPRVRMRVRCSKGTYIRTLCEDIGIKIGCGACMEWLERTASGVFKKENAYHLSQIEHAMQTGTIDKLLLPVDFVFQQQPNLRITMNAAKRLRNGNALSKTDFIDADDAVLTQSQVCIYDEEGKFAAIYGFNHTKEQFRPVKMFLQS